MKRRQKFVFPINIFKKLLNILYDNFKTNEFSEKFKLVSFFDLLVDEQYAVCA